MFAKEKISLLFFFFNQSLVYEWIWDDWLIPINPIKLLVSNPKFQFWISTNGNNQYLTKALSLTAVVLLDISLSLSLSLSEFSLRSHFTWWPFFFLDMLLMMIKICVKIANPDLLCGRDKEKSDLTFFFASFLAFLLVTICFGSYYCSSILNTNKATLSRVYIFIWYI